MTPCLLNPSEVGPLQCLPLGFHWSCLPTQIHWFSIFNSFMMVIFLTGLVSMILLRTLRNDYAKCDPLCLKFWAAVWCTMSNQCPPLCPSWLVPKHAHTAMS